MSTPTPAELQVVVDAVIAEAVAFDAWMDATSSAPAVTTAAYDAWIVAGTHREHVVQEHRQRRNLHQGSDDAKDPRPLPLSDGWHGPCTCHRTDGTHAAGCERVPPYYGDPTRPDPAAMRPTT